MITGVGLPGGMNGRQLADAVRLTRPTLKVLFVTGFAENAAIGAGQLPQGMEVIQAVPGLRPRRQGRRDHRNLTRNNPNQR